MNRYFFVGAALLLSATTAGIAIAAAAGGSGYPTAERHVLSTVSETAGGGDRPMLFASGSREHDRRADRLAKHDRRHHDDDDDEDEDGGRGAIPQNGPASPNAPVPDNGLFKGNSRPKVQVQ